MMFIVLLLIQISIFAGLVALFRVMVKKQIGAATGHLETMTQDTTKKLDEAKKKTREADDYYDKTVGRAKDEGEIIKNQLMQEGVQIKQETIDQSHKQAEEIMDRAHAAATIIREELQKRISDGATKKAEDLIQAVLVGRMREETHAFWVQELLQSGFETLHRLYVPAHIKEAKLVSAFPLKASDKTILQNKLKERLAREITIKEEVDDKLILGLNLTVGDIVIDGSLRHKIREALQND